MKMKNKEGQVIQYIDGFAWGVTPMGGTVCLGTETDVKDRLKNSRRHSKNPIIAQIIELERALNSKEAKRERKLLEKEEAERLERRERAKTLGIPLAQSCQKVAKKRPDCPVCLKNKATSTHHITPLDAGGTNTKRNKVYLCKTCHDIVEDYNAKGVVYSPALVTLIRLNDLR